MSKNVYRFTPKYPTNEHRHEHNPKGNLENSKKFLRGNTPVARTRP
ncbi:hypothetical protein M1M38_gp002 [Halorubrum tailed virus 27]|uniref:Uncharacterized protein n=1 Tax=Halorubrum tailed virus 27 TaxID=2878008 RepID=A0AAE8XXU7_9CAUD|nr:hypothetical protein M1M38_gp002 [Halorubrum tailed virus 27]UBF22695.1 hypothetical protein HRTV-27_gp2 [Halorubrum tailed virus 27]